jgi:FkbM family methyltransferase
MPLYRAKYRRYDAIPAELADAIRKSRGALRMIDVGANVGDTILSTTPRAGDQYLALEPHPDFFPYLVANTEELCGVTCLQLACGETSGTLGFDPALGGTAAPRVGRPAQHQVSVQPLDKIWKEQWQHAPVDFLKVDTDGFDVTVLHGALELLCSQQPWLFYECDVRLTENGLERHLGIRGLLGDAGYHHVIAFDNVGKQVACISVGDPASWSKLFAMQRAAGPVHYHDLLAVPAGENQSLFVRSVV